MAEKDPNQYNPLPDQLKPFNPRGRKRSPIYGFDLETNAFVDPNDPGSYEFPLQASFLPYKKTAGGLEFDADAPVMQNQLIYPPGTNKRNYRRKLRGILNQPIERGGEKTTLGKLTNLKVEDWENDFIPPITQEEFASRVNQIITPGTTLVGHNIQQFDARVIGGVLKRGGYKGLGERGVQKIDTYELASDIYSRYKSTEQIRGELNNTNRKNLPAIAKYLGIPYTNVHTSSYDAMTSAQVANRYYFGTPPPITPGVKTTGADMPPPQEPPRRPPPPPPPQEPPGRPSGNNWYRSSWESDEQPLQSFAAHMVPLLSSANRQGVQNRVEVIPFENEGFVRFGVYSPTEKNPITLDLKPGPRDVRGRPTVVSYHEGEWVGDWEPEVFAKSEGEFDLTATGFKSIQRYVTTAFNSDIMRVAYPESPQKRFNTLRFEGLPEERLVGRHQMQGPMTPPLALQQAVSRLSIGYGMDVKDTGKARENLLKKIAFETQQAERQGLYQKRASELTEAERQTLEWASFAGYVPTKEDKDIDRLSPLYHAQVEEGVLQAYGLGEKEIDAIKRRTLLSGRDVAELYELHEGKLRTATPEYIQGTSKRQMEGYRYATIADFETAERDKAVITKGVAIVPSTPLSGAMIMYDDPLRHRKDPIVSGYYQKNERLPLPPVAINQLSDLKMELGLMEAVRDDEGKIIDYKKIEDLKGATLREDKTYTIGWYQFGQGPKTGLDVTTGGSRWTINDIQGLVIPSHYKEEYEPSSGIEPAGGKTPTSSALIASQLQEMLGIPVRASGGKREAELILGVGLHTGVTSKGLGSKETLFEPPTLETEQYRRLQVRPRVTLEGAKGNESRVISGMTGEVKDLTAKFGAAFRYRTPEQQIQWVGELARIPGLEATAANLQEYLRANVQGKASTADVGELAMIYARGAYPEGLPLKGQDETQIQRLYYNELMAKLRFVTEEVLEPTKAYQKYGWAKVGEEMRDLFPVTESERREFRYSYLGGASMYMEDLNKVMLRGKDLSPAHRKLMQNLQAANLWDEKAGMPLPLNAEGGISKRGMRALQQIVPGGLRDLINFRPSGNRDAPWIMQQRSPAILADYPSALAPEFMAKTPHIGISELIGLETQWSEVAQFMGFTTKAGPYGPVEAGTGFRTKRIEAYKQMGDIVRYGTDKVTLAGRVIGKEEAENLLVQMNALEDSGDLNALTKLLGDQPLVAGAGTPRPGSAMLAPSAVKSLTYSPFDWESEYYEPVDRLTKNYVPSLFEWLREITGAKRGNREAYFQQEMRNIFAGATDTIKNIQAYQSKQIIGGRYGAATGIGFGTSVVSQGELNRILRAVGGRAGQTGPQYEQWRQAAMKQIEGLGGLPGLTTRYPFQSREAGWMFSSFVTPEMLSKQTGIGYREATQFIGQYVKPGSPWQTGMVSREGLGSIRMSGDWDADLATKAGILTLNELFGTPLVSNLKNVGADAPIDVINATKRLGIFSKEGQEKLGLSGISYLSRDEWAKAHPDQPNSAMIHHGAPGYPGRIEIKERDLEPEKVRAREYWQKKLGLSQEDITFSELAHEVGHQMGDDWGELVNKSGLNPEDWLDYEWVARLSNTQVGTKEFDTVLQREFRAVTFAQAAGASPAFAGYRKAEQIEANTPIPITEEMKAYAQNKLEEARALENREPFIIPRAMREALKLTETQRRADTRGALGGIVGSRAGIEGGIFNMIAMQGRKTLEQISWLEKSGAHTGGQELHDESEYSTYTPLPPEEIAAQAGKITGRTRQTAEEAGRKAHQYIQGGKGGMGIENTLQRRMLAQAIGMGFGPTGEARVSTSSGIHYQVPLDFMWKVPRALGGQSVLSSFIESSVFGSDKLGSTLSILAKPSAKGRFQTYWTEGMPTDYLTKELATRAQQDYENYINLADDKGVPLIGQAPAKGFIGSLFASRAEDIPWVENRFNELYGLNPERAVERTLTGPGGYSEYYEQQTGNKYDIFDTTLGGSMLDKMLMGVSLENRLPSDKPARTVKVYNPATDREEDVPLLRQLGRHMLGDRMLRDYESSPRHAVSIAAFRYLARKGIPGPKANALMQRVIQQSVNAAKEVSPELAHMVATWGGEADLEAVNKARMQAGGQDQTLDTAIAALQTTPYERLMVSGSQIPKLMSTQRQQQNMGIQPEWAESAFQMFAAQNIFGWGREGSQVSRESLAELFPIEEKYRLQGEAFQTATEEAIKREHPEVSRMIRDLKTVEGHGANINLEDITTAKERSMIQIPNEYKMGIHITPDVLSIVGAGDQRRILLAEAKGGHSQGRTGALQTFIYGMSLQRLAGWDPLTQAPWGNRGSRGKFKSAIEPMLEQGSVEYQTATPDAQRAMVEEYYQLARQGKMEMQLFQPGPGGAPTPTTLLPGGGGGIGDYTSLFTQMQVGLRNAANFMSPQNRAQQQAVLAALYQRVQNNPQLNIPENDPLRTIGENTPDTALPHTYVNAGRGRGRGGRGSGTQTATDIVDDDGPRGSGISIRQLQQVLKQAMTEGINESKLIEILGSEGGNTYAGVSQGMRAAAVDKMNQFRATAKAVEALPVEEMLTDFGVNVMARPEGADLSQWIGEALQNGRNNPKVREFLQRNAPMLVELTKLGKRARSAASGSRVYNEEAKKRWATEEEFIQEGMFGGFTAPLLSDEDRFALAYYSGFSSYSPERGQSQRNIRGVGQAVNFASLLLGTAADQGIVTTGGTLKKRPDAGAYPGRFTLASEQLTYLGQTERMLENYGQQYLMLSEAGRKSFLAEDKMMASKWTRENLQALRTQVFGDRIPMASDDDFARYVRLNTQLKKAEDTELADLDRLYTARGKKYLEDTMGPVLRQFGEYQTAYSISSFDRQYAYQRDLDRFGDSPLGNLEKKRKAAERSYTESRAALRLTQLGEFAKLQASGAAPTGADIVDQPLVAKIAAEQYVDPKYQERTIIQNLLQGNVVPESAFGPSGSKGGLELGKIYARSIVGKIQKKLDAATDISPAARDKLFAARGQWETYAQTFEALTNTEVVGARQDAAGKLLDVTQKIATLDLTQTQQREDLELEKKLLTIQQGTEGRLTRIQVGAQRKREATIEKYQGKTGERAAIESKFEARMDELDALATAHSESAKDLINQLDAMDLSQITTKYKKAGTRREKAEALRDIGLAIADRATKGLSRVGEMDLGKQAIAVGAAEIAEEEEAVRLKREKDEEMGPAGRIGGMARRLFGGFGLLYMRSIAGLVTTGAYTGYQERLQMQQEMAQPFLGVGGEMPVTAAEKLARVQAVQYGGQGGILMQNARLAIMQNQQPLYNVATTGLAGVSAGGMATWLGEGFGLTKRQSLGAGLATAGLVMAGNEILNIIGASQDVEGTAMNLAVRKARGENFTQTWGTAIATSAAAGAGIGTAINPGLGTLIGGVAGGLIGFGSNYQQIAAMRSPAIQKQTQILNALTDRGDRTVQQVLAQFNVSPDQAAYYGRLAAQIEAATESNRGITEAGWAAAAAYEVRRGASLGTEGRAQYALLAQAGYNPEAMGMMAAQAAGMSVFQANAPIVRFGQQAPATPVTPQQFQQATQNFYMANPETSILGYAGPRDVLLPSQVPTLSPSDALRVKLGLLPKENILQPPEESAITRYTEAAINWAKQRGGDVAGEQAQAAYSAIGAMGNIGVEEVYERTRITSPRLKPEGYESWEAWQYEQQMKYGETLAGLQATGWLEPYRQGLVTEITAKSLGLAAKPTLTAEEFAAAHPTTNAEEQAAYMQYQQESNVRNNMVQQWRQSSIANFGYLPTYSPNVTGLEVQQGMAQTAYGGQLGQQLILGGMEAQTATAIGGAFQGMSPEMFRQYQGLFTMQPLQVAGFAMANPQVWGGVTARGPLPGIGGSQINPYNLGRADYGISPANTTDIPGLTGLPWGTTSMANPSRMAGIMDLGFSPQQAAQFSAMAEANMAFGQGWQAEGGFGGQVMQTLMQEGTFGYARLQQESTARYQRASIGNQFAQLALQEKYMPQFWALEDQMRNLGYRQQEWSFGQQEKQLEMSNRFWQQNFGLNVQQSQMQRGWAREDWGFQDVTRNMQWGWRQEDYQEQVRFMTGRQRKLAERQMERETIMHGMEGDQIDRQRKRQEELWALEDQRFAIAKAQQEESMKFQQEAIEQQRKFFEERKKIELEQVELQRAYWKEQHELQKAAAGAAATYTEEQITLNEKMLQFSQYSQAAAAEGNLLNPETMTSLADSLVIVSPAFKSLVFESMEKLKLDLPILNPLFAEFIIQVEKGIKALGGTVPTVPDDGTDPPLCFVADTPVSTPYGDVAIQDIKVGDIVYSYDEEWNSCKLGEVEKTFSSEAREVVLIQTEHGMYRCTRNHRWYTSYGWKIAIDLDIDDEILMVNGTFTKITSVSIGLGIYHVYNFSVTKYHTYYVGGHLVHNKKPANPEMAPTAGFQNPWNNQTVLNPTPGTEKQGQVINIYLGNEKISSFVLKTVKEDLEVK